MATTTRAPYPMSTGESPVIADIRATAPLENRRLEGITGPVTLIRTFGSVEELQQAGGSQLDRRYIGGVLVETLIGTAAATKRYLFHDHLGSLDVIANESGAVLERLSFDAHGQRRAATQWTSTLPAVVSAFTPCGITGHEHLDVFGLIHMNGRVYDPTLGRFIQPDPMLDADIQGLNHDSYLLNYPVSLTDPRAAICPWVRSCARW